MTDNRDNHTSPHGVTGDTVEQAAEVSRPTSDRGRVLDDPRVPQAPADPPIVADVRTRAGAGGKRRQLSSSSHRRNG